MDAFLVGINDLCNDLNDNFPTANHGGCAVVAAILGQHLSAYGVVRIVVGDDQCTPITIENARKLIHSNTLKEWNKNGLWFGHVVVVEFDYNGDTWHIDTTGVYPASEYLMSGDFPVLEGVMTLHEITELSNSAGWNTAFQRRHIPNIRAMIERKFGGM